MASKALVTFSNIWCWLFGLWIFRSVRFCKASTNATRHVPSHKSVLKSFTDNPNGRRCSFTQFRNVWAWISIQRSSFPLICIPFAAWPSGLRARSPTWNNKFKLQRLTQTQIVTCHTQIVLWGKWLLSSCFWRNFRFFGLVLLQRCLWPTSTILFFHTISWLIVITTPYTLFPNY